MGLLLLVLAYMVFMLMTCNDQKTVEATTSVASFTNVNAKPIHAKLAHSLAGKNVQNFTNSVINYEHMENAPGPVDKVGGAEPAVFKSANEMEESQYAKVNYTGLVDANPEDVLQIEGTDLLTAPLVDNMLYTNSIANTNRNASNDLRGDIPLQFNESYTPFYSSVIYGAPLSERAMTLNSLPQYGPVGPVGPFGKGITATA
jgi:hypothetical protein